MASGIEKRRASKRKGSDPNYHQRRQEIAVAAAHVFNQRGFRGTTIGAVAEELGLDRASLYYYISSKEELFDEVIREASEDNVATAKRIQASDVPPREKLRQLIIELMRSYARHYPLLYIFIRENLSHVADQRSRWARQMKQISREYDDALLAIIEEGYADGSFHVVGPARIVSHGIVGMVGWTNRWFRPERSEVSAEEIGRTYADLVVSGLDAKNVSRPAAIVKPAPRAARVRAARG